MISIGSAFLDILYFRANSDFSRVSSFLSPILYILLSILTSMYIIFLSLPSWVLTPNFSSHYHPILLSSAIYLPLLFTPQNSISNWFIIDDLISFFSSPSFTFSIFSIFFTFFTSSLFFLCSFHDYYPPYIFLSSFSSIGFYSVCFSSLNDLFFNHLSVSYLLL